MAADTANSQPITNIKQEKQTSPRQNLPSSFKRTMVEIELCNRQTCPDFLNVPQQPTTNNQQRNNAPRTTKGNTFSI
jgi:hypothetical protein